MKFYRGATYKLPIRLLKDNTGLSLDDIEQVDFSFGSDLIKSYPADSSITREEENKLIVFLSSDDTLSLKEGMARLQARIVFKDNDAKFTKEKSYVAVTTQFD